MYIDDKLFKFCLQGLKHYTHGLLRISMHFIGVEYKPFEGLSAEQLAPPFSL